MARPDLNTIRTNFQVADDEMIDYRPRAFGAIDIPFTDSVRMTKTEGALIDKLTLDRGLVGLRESVVSRIALSAKASNVFRTIPFLAIFRPEARMRGRATTAIAMHSAMPTGMR
jgi:hypothetical protein